MQAIIQAAKTCTGIDIKGLAVPKKPCEACAVGKATQTIRRAMPTIPRATKVGELIHVDVGGGGKLVRGLNNEKYWVGFIDDVDGWATVKFVAYKHHVKHAVKEYVREYERDHETVIQALHSLDDVVSHSDRQPRVYAPRRDTVIGI
jgi:hypothetical protein